MKNETLILGVLLSDKIYKYADYQIENFRKDNEVVWLNNIYLNNLYSQEELYLLMHRSLDKLEQIATESWKQHFVVFTGLIATLWGFEAFLSIMRKENGHSLIFVFCLGCLVWAVWYQLNRNRLIKLYCKDIIKLQQGILNKNGIEPSQSFRYAFYY